ncbi:MAG: hypothetical protein ACTS2F_05250 [Thainema sp.]
MAQLKRWESPRRKGRNRKGRGGSARQRQLIKRQKQLQKKLKQQTDRDSSNQGSTQNPSSKRKARTEFSPFALSLDFESVTRL